MSFSPLDWDILISSFENIKLSFSNYPCLQALEVHKYEDIENAIILIINKTKSGNLVGNFYVL